MSHMRTINRGSTILAAIIVLLTTMAAALQAQSGARSVFGAGIGQMGNLPLRFNGNAQADAHGPLISSGGFLRLTLTPGPYRLGSAYYRPNVDVRQGFTSRFFLQMGGNR